MTTQRLSVGAQYWMFPHSGDYWHPVSYMQVHRSIMETYTHLNLFTVHGRLLNRHLVWAKYSFIKRTTYPLTQQPIPPALPLDTEKEEAIQYAKHLIATTSKEE